MLKRPEALANKIKLRHYSSMTLKVIKSLWAFKK